MSAELYKGSSWKACDSLIEELLILIDQIRMNSLESERESKIQQPSNAQLSN